MEVKATYYKGIVIFEALFFPVVFFFFQPNCFDCGQEPLFSFPNGSSFLAPNMLFWTPKLCLRPCPLYSVGLRSGTFIFSSVAQLCPTLFNPMNCSTPGFPVHHQLLALAQTHVQWVNDAIQPSHPLPSPSLPAPNSSQLQSLFQWVSSSHEVAKVLEFQL